MKHLYETTYLDHEIKLFLDGKKWVCTASKSKDGQIVEQVVSDFRENAIDILQHKLDLASYGADKSVQISNLPLFDWLEER